MSPSCRNEPAFIFMCHTLQFSAIISVVLYCFMFYLAIFYLVLLLLLFPCTCVVIVFLVASSPSFLPSLKCSHTIAVVLSEEGCHWFNVGFPPDVVMSHPSTTPSSSSFLSHLSSQYVVFQNGTIGDAATSDILQQALVNSGLTATHIENGQGDGVSRAGDAVSSMSMTEALMSNVAAFSRLDGTVSTMAIHDSATGHVKRHIIRKVSLSPVTLLVLPFHVFHVFSKTL